MLIEVKVFRVGNKKGHPREIKYELKYEKAKYTAKIEAEKLFRREK